jgi:uncharacterized protein (TIGR02270 family)
LSNIDPAVDRLWDVVEEHLDEVEFGVGEAELMLESPVQTLVDLPAWGEWRYVAHVDGLVIAGAPALERVVLPALEAAESPERVTAAALALLEMAPVEQLLPVLGHADAQVRRAVARACSLGTRGEVLASFAQDRLRSAASANERAGLLDVMAEMGVWSASAGRLLDSDEPAVAAASVRAARFSQDPQLLAALERRFSDADPDVVEAALVAAATLGSKQALEALEAHALGAEPARPGALALLASLGGPRQHERIAAQVGSKGRAGATLFALGFGGNLEHVSLLLEQLDSKDAALVKLAAQSLSLVLGIDLRDEALHLPPPVLLDDIEAPAAEDELPSVEEEPDALAPPWPEETLPDLDLPALRTAVAAARAGLDLQRRHQMGRPYSPSSVAALLRDAPLRRRHTFAQLAFIDSGGQSFVNTRASAAIQARQLAAAPEPPGRARRFPIW